MLPFPARWLWVDGWVGGWGGGVPHRRACVVAHTEDRGLAHAGQEGEQGVGVFNAAQRNAHVFACLSWWRHPHTARTLVGAVSLQVQGRLIHHLHVLARAAACEERVQAAGNAALAATGVPTQHHQRHFRCLSALPAQVATRLRAEAVVDRRCWCSVASAAAAAATNAGCCRDGRVMRLALFFTRDGVAGSWVCAIYADGLTLTFSRQMNEGCASLIRCATSRAHTRVATGSVSPACYAGCAHTWLLPWS